MCIHFNHKFVEIQPCQLKQDDSLPQIQKCVCSPHGEYCEQRTLGATGSILHGSKQMQDELHQFDRLKYGKIVRQTIRQVDVEGFDLYINDMSTFKYGKLSLGLKQAQRRPGTMNYLTFTDVLRAFLRDVIMSDALIPEKDFCGIQFLGINLISMVSKKQNFTANVFCTEAE
ncbi:hypothetical protein Tco_0630037 [Tanacetum coccineum]